MRDALGEVFVDEEFAELFAVRGHPSTSPARLVMVPVLQFAERLTDRRAAEAVRGRVDGKFLLGLPLEDPGFDTSCRRTPLRERRHLGTQRVPYPSDSIRPPITASRPQPPAAQGAASRSHAQGPWAGRAG
ncbi:transposase, partial [Streptomyces violascens]